MLLMRGIQWLALAGLALILTGCGPEQVTIDGKTMGTYYRIKYLQESATPAAEQIKKEIESRLEQLNEQMSTYRPGSELSRFNQNREVGIPFPVSAATIKVVNEAIRISHLTDGGLDITIGPLVNLWGFGPEGRRDHAPDPQELEKRRTWVGIEKLQVKDGALIKTIPELYLDLSAIAKGYGVDMLAEYLQSLPVDNYMVDIGGEVRTKGKNGKGTPWRIAIEKPQAGGQQWIQEVIEPGSMAIATSGDYRNYFESDGHHYSHTLDPRTGYPIQHNMVSITVLATSCMTADGFATGLGVLGPERGMAVANQLNIPILMITKTKDGFAESYSSAFKPYLRDKQIKQN